jgi:hypothetical protein
MVIVGIDLGVTGAIAAVDHSGSSVIHDLPIVQDHRGKRLDAPAFVRLMRELVPADEVGFAVAEDVHVMKVAGRAMSHSTETTLVGLRFAAQAAVDILRMRLELVRPQRWKAHYGIKADKTGAMARDLASTLYPLRAAELKRVKDHNRAEAVLIAHYALRTMA